MYPADWKPDTTYRPAAKAAKEYPFTLDPFQKQAIQYIERNESVLVSAHTSAGKVRCTGLTDVRAVPAQALVFHYSNDKQGVDSGD